MTSFRKNIALLGAFALAACAGDPNAPNRAPVAEKWLTRAKVAYRAGDLEDATSAIDGALKAAPKDDETRLLAARIALAKLEYTEALKLTEGLSSSDAKGLRGRAYWYAGDIERAADELEDMLKDPQIKDNWAKEVAKLARRGHGRHPFAIEGGLVAAVEMPQAGPALIVPCELEGERILAIVATNMGELMIDASTRKEPAWVNLRFGDRLEVKDVPALTTDLSNISRQLGAPIKALLGVNALRHMHVTFDRRASQFVVRKADPPPPPDASKVPLFYVRGGGMMMRGAVSSKDEGNAVLFVDSSAFYPLALDDQLLQRSGANLSSFQSAPGAPPNWKLGMLPYFRIGQLDLSAAQVPAMQGAPLGEIKSNFDVDLGGVVGAGLLAAFRVTFGEDGRWLWLEMDPAVMQSQPGRPAVPPMPGDAGGQPSGPPSGPPPKSGPPAPPGSGAPPAPPKTGPAPGPAPAVGPLPPPGATQGPPKPGATGPTPPKSESKGAAK